MYKKVFIVIFRNVIFILIINEFYNLNDMYYFVIKIIM